MLLGAKISLYLLSFMWGLVVCLGVLYADLRLSWSHFSSKNKGQFTHAMPFPCRVNSHIPCCDPAILRQCRVLRKSPRGRRKYPNCYSASGDNLRGTPRGNRKKPNAGRSPTCRLWTADANSHAVPIPRCAVALRSRFQNGMVVAWRGNGIECVN
jgi:hypothetical protein